MYLSRWFSRDVWRLTPLLWLLIAVAVLSTFVAMTAPRTIPPAYGVLAAVLLVTAARHGSSLTRANIPNWFSAGVILTIYIVVSTLWSEDPTTTMLTAAVIALLLATTLLLIRVSGQLPTEWLEHLTRAILIAGLAATAFLLVEEAFGHRIKKAIIPLVRAVHWQDGTLAFEPVMPVTILGHSTNWSMPLLAFMIWPLLLLGDCQLDGRARRVLQATTLLAGVGTILLSKHWTSMVAVTIGLAILSAAWHNVRATARALQMVWLGGFLAVVPLANTAFSNELHLYNGLKNSFQARIILWGVTAERFWQQPLLGVGAAATRRRDRETYKEAEARKPANFHYALRTGPHAHNFELQSLYELGVVGTFVFAVFGLVVIEAVSRAERRARPYLIAATATVGAMGLSSFGLFEIWFMAAFAMTALAGALGAAYWRRLGKIA